MIGEQQAPLTRISSRNIYTQNFEIAILFSVVERSGNYVFGDDLPRALSARTVRYAPSFNGKGVQINFGRGSLDWK